MVHNRTHAHEYTRQVYVHLFHTWLLGRKGLPELRFSYGQSPSKSLRYYVKAQWKPQSFQLRHAKRTYLSSYKAAMGRREQGVSGWLMICKRLC